MSETWAEADAYEPYVGRWSRRVAREFVRWLGADANRGWLDVGCGTGALSHTILAHCSPRRLLAVDRSATFAAAARARARGTSSHFAVADALALPVADGALDVAVSALVLNFVPDPGRMLAEMVRSVRAGGCVALYVWDYAGRMDLLRHFWDAVTELDPGAAMLDEGRRFPICSPGPLEALSLNGGLRDVEVSALDVATVFADFDDLWSPFLGGQGPAPGYVAGLDESARARLRERLRSRLPIEADGSIVLNARAWAVRGVK